MAVMNQNPPGSGEFGTAPFLPPPPTHPKKQEPTIMGGGDRYAALESYNHNNNILQQQQSSSGGAAFGNAFLDEGESILKTYRSFHTKFVSCQHQEHRVSSVRAAVLETRCQLLGQAPPLCRHRTAECLARAQHNNSNSSSNNNRSSVPIWSV